VLRSKDHHDAGWAKTADRSLLYKDPTTPERRKKLQRYLKPIPLGARILDFGCGRAGFTSFLASLGYHVVGLDLSSEAIRLNRHDFPQIDFVQVNEDQKAPLPDASFDAIWCSEVIEHVYDVNGIFSEFARLLRSGGRLIVTTPYHGWVKNLLVMSFGFERHFDVEWQHIRFWTRRSLTEISTKHGLRPIVWDSLGRIPCVAKSFLVVFERVAG
jgi:SAM-dependent methyltransferase